MRYSAVRRGERLGGVLEVGAAGLAVALLAWAPLPLGSNRGWSKALLVVAVAAVVAVGAAGMLLRGRRVTVPRRLAWAGALLAGVIAWAWIQAAVGPVLGPSLAHPLWGQVGGLGLDGAVPALSLDAAATRTALLPLASYGLLFWLAFALGQDDRLARMLAVGLVATATGWAAWGILRWFAGLDPLLHPGEPTTEGITANFPNRSHFADYVNLALLVVVARLSRRLMRPRGSGPPTPLRTALSEAATYLLERRAPWFAAGVVLAAASLGSTSRGGFLSLGLALVVLVALVLRRSAVGVGRALLVPAATAALVLALVPSAGSTLLDRLEQLDLDYVQGDVAGPGRLAAWEVAIALIGQRPLVGHGYGTFVQAFPLLADERFVTVEAGRAVPLFYDYAHNVYLEAAVELGLPAAAALCLAMLLATSVCLRRDRSGLRRRTLPLAAAAGAVAIATHGLVDFSIQIPAVAAAFAVLLGAGCGQAVAAGAAVRPEARATASATAAEEAA